MIFYTDDIRRIQSLDLILFHLHAVDTYLNDSISSHLDLAVQQVHLHSRQHHLLQQIHTVSRSLHLTIRREDHFFIGMARLGRGTNRYAF